MSRTRRLIALCGLVSAILMARPAFRVASGSPASPPDTILFNGRIVTVDRRFSYAEAIAIAGSRFTAVGTTAAIRKLTGARTTLIDLRGRTVVPGLSDGHLHGAGGGTGVDLSRARTLDAVLSAIGRRAQERPRGEVVVTNGDWHEAQLKEQRLPLRQDLDRVAPETPIVMVRGGHEYILNSAALAKWHITRTTPDPPGGRISRDGTGEPTGELVDTARALVTLPPVAAPTLEQQIADTRAEHNRLNAAGLTSIRVPGASVDDLRRLQQMRRRGLLTLRVTVLLRPDRDIDPDTIQSVIDHWGVGPDDGDEWVRIGGVKLAVDGGFEGGWMREPYAEPFGQSGRFRGLQTIPADRYTAIVTGFNRRGWRVATHAVGDAAVDQVLAAYEAADAERTIAGRRWVLEHGFIADPDQLPRLKALDLVISAQNHLYLAGPSLARYWGPERAARTTPMRSFLDAGLVVAAGTDSPVVPFPPLWTIYHFVSRQTISAGVMGAEQRISREEALRASTMGNAYLTFQENVAGSIEPGKLADLTVLSDDIMTCPEKRIEEMTVLMTVVAGKTVFEHRNFRHARR